MQAIAFHEHGGPDKLVSTTFPDPVPKPGEVLVRVEAVALNHLDIWVREGLPGLKLPLPHVLGSDVAGEVVGTGAKVIVNPGFSCLACRECLSGRDNLCRHYRLIGEHMWGGYGELVAVPASNLVPRPANLSAIEAATLPVTFLTAWQMLALRARVEPGETVVIIAGGSGVGSAGIQIAKLFGARVIATVTSAAKAERCRELGADEVVDTSTVALSAAVKELTGKRGADVVFEHVGKAIWAEAILACAKGGRLVTCGATTGFDAVTDLRHVFYRQIQVLGSTMGPKGSLFEIVAHAASGKLRAVVDTIMPFADVRAAHERLEARGQFGKIVLVP